MIKNINEKVLDELIEKIFEAKLQYLLIKKVENDGYFAEYEISNVRTEASIDAYAKLVDALNEFKSMITLGAVKSFNLLFTSKDEKILFSKSYDNGKLQNYDNHQKAADLMKKVKEHIEKSDVKDKEFQTLTMRISKGNMKPQYKNVTALEVAQLLLGILE